MTTVVKIVKILVSNSLLVHRQFNKILESEYGDLQLHNNVRWLSHGEVLSRFACCLEAIK